MSLSDANLAKIRNVYQRDFLELPLAKDLPRLAKFISICDEDGVRLSYKENQPLDIDHYLQEKGPDFLIFYQVRRVLLTLTLALEGPNKCVEVDKALLHLLDTHDFLLPEVMNPFLGQHFGDTSKVVRVLKCINQAAIAPSLIELKMAMGVENTTKDVAGTWRIFVVLESDSLRVFHIKKEVCIQNHFILEWKLRFSLSYHQMDQLRGISFEIIDMMFNPSTVTPKRAQDLRNLVKPYLSSKIKSFLEQHTPQMLQPVSKDILEGDALPPPTPLMGEIYYLKLPHVLYVHQQCQENTRGIVLLSNYAIYFHSRTTQIRVPITCISKISRRKDRKEREVEIVCKDIRTMRLILGKGEIKPLLEMVSCLTPTNYHHVFADAYSKALVRDLTPVQSSSFALLQNGWRFYQIEEEFERMQIDMTQWRVSDLNTRYQLSESYPRLLVVPLFVSDAELLTSCRYRQAGRVPVLSWQHRNGSILSHGAAPISDTKTNLSREDDKILAAMIRTVAGHSSDPLQASSVTYSYTRKNIDEHAGRSNKNKLLRAISKRPERVNVGIVSSGSRTSVASVRGAVDCQQTQFCFIDIHQSNLVKSRDLQDFEDIPTNVSLMSEAIYVEGLSELKDSYKKLHKLCTGGTSLNDDHWYSALDNTRWIEQISTLLKSTRRIVELMEARGSIFLNCPGDGWDRGCQISSLAQLWMDPYYRTIRGFCVLIEKEWLSFGHQFTQRHGYLTSDDTVEVVPVFLQWLDAVWQTLQQFPDYFEFTSALLVVIAEESFGGRYGTFLFDNDLTRKTFLCRMNTESLWMDVVDNFAYRNPFYKMSSDCVVPSSNPRVLALWTGFHLRWYEGRTVCKLPREGVIPNGKDVLSLHGAPAQELSVKQQLSQHLQSLQMALKVVQDQIHFQQDVVTRTKQGAPFHIALADASRQMRKSSPQGSSRDDLVAPSPVQLRRHTRLSDISTSRRSVSQSSCLRRRSSVPDTGDLEEPPTPENKRKSQSVYIHPSQMNAFIAGLQAEADKNDTILPEC